MCGDAGRAPVADEELMEQFVEGSEEAFDDLVARYAGRITSFVHRQVLDFAVAEEIAQDTFMAVYRKRETFKAGHKFSGWIYKIAINFCRMHFRKKRSQVGVVPIHETREEEGKALEDVLADDGEGPREALSRREAEEKLRQAIAELPRKQRLVFTLSFYDEMTYEEIGRLLGCSPGTVASRKHAAVKKLASKLSKVTLGEFG